VSQVGSMTIVGLAVGAIGARFAGGLITPLLFAVQRSDISNVIAPLICLLAAGALSALLPVVRATRIDPAIALRSD
jgi:ABC-type antimicrobial peptide transport system permease subunit